MSCSHILGAIILRPGNSQFPKIKILPYCILSAHRFRLRSTRRVPYFSVGNGTAFPKGKLCVCRELDRSGFLPTPIPFGLLRVMGSLGGDSQRTVLNGRNFRMEWSGVFSCAHPNTTTYQPWSQLSRKFH